MTRRRTKATPPTTTERGYGHQHQQLRTQWKPKVDARRVDCARCGLRIIPDPTQLGDGWQLDHDPTDPTRRRYLGPSHTSCNQGGGPPAPHDPEPAPRTDW